MSSHQLILDAQSAAHSADLVLEQHPQRLHDLQIHLLRQPAHIVVGLDFRSDSLYAGRFDDVRVDGSLGQPAGIADSPGVFVESFDEEPSDDLPFGFRIADSGKLREELLRCVSSDHVEVHALVGLEDIFIFILPEQAVVYEYAGEVMPYGLVEQGGGHCRVHASAEPEDDFVVPDLLPDRLHLYERIRSPVALASAYSQSEIAENPAPFRRVEDLRVELDGVGFLSLETEGCVGHVLRRCDDLRPFRQPGDGVSVRHPDL